MVKVTVEQVAKPAEYSPKIRVEFQAASCVQSNVSWGNPALMLALRNLFDLNNKETLGAIVVDEKGMTAEIIRT